jgi:exopolyphosphatase / guanosine-5'-triphosphate,3'-diphosphate pyrophosphatase
VLLLDLGGGSCEITLSEHKRIKETISLPLGAVRLTEQFLPTDPLRQADGLARMRQLIARELRRAHRRFSRGRAPLVIATSGTAAALSDAGQRRPGMASPGAKGQARSAGKARRRINQSRRDSRAGIVPTREVRKLAGKARQNVAAGARSRPGHRPAAGGDYRGRRAGLRRTA